MGQDTATVAGPGTRQVAQLRDVARLAGVSTATASRILRDPSQGSPEARRRVLAAAQELEYRPKGRAIRPRRKGTPTVATLIPFTTALPLAEILGPQLEAIAAHHAFSPAVIFYTHSQVPEVVEQLVCQGTCGVLLNEGPRADELLNALPRDLAVVIFNGSREWVVELSQRTTRALVGVSTDRAAGTALAVSHLVGLGHRRIALSRYIGHDKLEGYLQAMPAHGLVVSDDLLLDCSSDAAHSLETLVAQMAACVLGSRPRPTAVICANDEIAVGLIGELARAGLRVPADISVIGWNGTSLSRNTYPRVTSIYQDYSAMARECVGLVSRWIAQGGPPEVTGVTFRVPSLSLGESTGPAPPSGAGS